MASEGKARPNKQMTITFTLPISCQICLGKVRQPVLCPNHHVFCNLCLDIWLSKSKQCPACRVDIGPDNPVRHIIGSQLEDENSEARSTPEFRRARFDVLYREYEDELEMLHKDNAILKMQNNILTAQLQDTEHKKTISENGKNGSVPHPSPQTPAGLRLLQLSKNLQEVHKLYQGIKTEMAELKQENCRLKDESVNLTRENENLRLEIAQRSPKKFGRYTVATLEAKLAEQEKEIRQLKKALERSDAYIEELQQQQDRQGALRHETDSLRGKARFQINLEPKRSETEGSCTDAGGPRKVLFGKVVDEETVKPSSKGNVFSALGSDKSLQKHPRDQVFRRHENLVADGSDSCHLQQHADSPNEPGTSCRSDIAHNKSHALSESVQVSSLTSVPTDSRETVGEIISDKTAKKVHFKEYEKPSDAASFDLEMPSPISSSHSSVSKDMSSPGQMSAVEARYDCQVKMETPSLEEEKEDGRRLINKSILSVKALKASKVVKKPNAVSRKKLKVPVVAKKVKQEPDQETMEDSSHLSVPDMTPAETIDNLSCVTDSTDGSDDFDMSMTPEMTNCLRLMDQAEKKVSSMTGTPRMILPQPESVLVSAHQVPQSSLSSDSSTFIQRPWSGSVPTTNINSGHRFASTGNNIMSWQQKFYNSLKVNPHRVGSTVHRPPGLPTESSHNPLTGDQWASGNKSEVYSFMDYNLSRDAASSKEFTFSEPVRVIAPSLEPRGRKLSSFASSFTSGTSSSSSTSASSFTLMTPSDI